MKVLLTHKFHSLTGGAEVFYFEVARVLKDNGHEIAFFSTESEENIDTGDVVHFVPAPEYNSGSIIKKFSGLNSIFYSKNNARKFEKVLLSFKPDVIHAFAIHVHLTPSILEVAKKHHIPVVMSCNDYKHICPNYKIFDGKKNCEACKGGKFYNAAIKRCCKGSLAFSVASSIEAYIHEHKNVYERFVDKYLFASEFMLSKTKEFWVNKKVNYGVLKNPFKPFEYEPIYSGEFALYFGRIIDEKGVDRIVSAARKARFPIKIVGDGPDLEKLRSLAEQQGLGHIEFLGPLWGKALNKVLAKAKFVVVPSLWHENFPYVIFQAFASGKPVIGSQRGGIPELVGSDRGLLFDPDNVDELAGNMLTLWNNDDLCTSLGKNARQYIVTEFNDAKFYKDIMENYRSVIN